MIKINIQKALSLIKEPNPTNIAEELIKRFNVLTIDKIERLYSILYYSGRIDFEKINDKNKINTVKAEIRQLSKESEKSQNNLEEKLIKDNLI